MSMNITKYIKCRDCETIHFTIPTIRDRQAKCAKCSGIKFTTRLSKKE